METFLVVLVVALALGFDFTNGFHDAANAIATSVSTRALTPRVALVMAAVMNFAGALIGNAIICGTFSNPHDRYQSRVIWLPTLVLILALTRDRRSLQPVGDAGN